MDQRDNVIFKDHLPCPGDLQTVLDIGIRRLDGHRFELVFDGNPLRQGFIEREAILNLGQAKEDDVQKFFSGDFQV